MEVLRPSATGTTSWDCPTCLPSISVSSSRLTFSWNARPPCFAPDAIQARNTCLNTPPTGDTWLL
eukprot:5814064-Pleurochrysis_carterae.AAC.1